MSNEIFRKERVMSKVAVSLDGLPIHYEIQRQGLPALVFVHGWCCDRSYWQKQLSHFALHYTVVAIDLGGHGDSGLNRSTWTMTAFGHDVVAVVEQLGLAQVVLIGHSMGGPVILEAARQMPTRVIGLIGVDTLGNLEQTRTKAEVDAFMAPFRTDFRKTLSEFVPTNMFLPTSDAALVSAIVDDMAAAPPQVACAAAEALLSYGADLQAMPAPLVLINADNQATDLAAAGRYGIPVNLMSGVGHFVMIEDPETFNHLLEETIKHFLAAASPKEQ